MDDEQLTQEQMQALWNEEANKLDAGTPPADEPQAAAAEETPPQDNPEPAEPQAAEPAADAQPQAAADPFEGLPPAVKAKLAQIDELAQANAQLLHHVKTAEGRVAAMQREFQQSRAAQTAVAPQDAPSQGQIAKAANNPEKWEQLKQDFPEWAGAMEEYVAAQLGSRSQQPQLTPEQVAGFVQQQVGQVEQTFARRLEEARIEGKHENWKDTVNTPAFAQWFTGQPADVQALASSAAARDAIRMLDLYEQAKARPASEVKQERGARLAAAATVRPGVTKPPKSLDDLTPEELWNHEAAQREKTRAQRGF